LQERLEDYNQARARTLCLGNLTVSYQRDVQRVVVREPEGPGAADVVRDFVGREVGQRGLQLAQGSAELRGHALPLELAGALSEQIAAGEEGGHRFRIEGRALQG